MAITFLAGGLTIGYFFGRRSGFSSAFRHNKRISLEKDKIADKVDLEDIGDKKVFCRCWQSKKVCMEIYNVINYYFSFHIVTEVIMHIINKQVTTLDH